MATSYANMSRLVGMLIKTAQKVLHICTWWTGQTLQFFDWDV